MDFSYTKEEEEFRGKLSDFLDKELTEVIARQNWEDKGPYQCKHVHAWNQYT